MIDLYHAIGRKVKCDLEQPCAQCVATRCTCFYDPHPVLNQAAAVGAMPWQSTRLEAQQLGSLNYLQQSYQSLVNQHSSQALMTVNGSKRPMEDELINLGRRISAIKEHLASPSAHNTSSNAQSWGTEKDTVQYKQQLDSFQRQPSQEKTLSLNKSRLYGPTHWLHGGHEVGQPIEHRFCHHLLTLSSLNGWQFLIKTRTSQQKKK